MKCPRCNQPLAKVKTDYGIVAMCQACFGHFLLEKNILQSIHSEKWNSILNYGKNQPGKKRIHCSSCKSLMNNHTLPVEFNSVQIDRCVNCKVIWFDKDKIEELNLLKKISTPNNRNLDYLAQGLLLDIKLDYKKKESERKRTNEYSSNSESDFGFYDSSFGDSGDSCGE